MSRNNAAVPVASLWRATSMVLDMFAARGYAHNVKLFQTDKFLFHEYAQHINSDLLKLSLSATDKRGKHVLACMVPDKQFKKEQATKLIADVSAMSSIGAVSGHKISKLILIWAQPGSVSATATLRQHYELETWTYTQAQSQFHRHMTVPMQRRLTKKEKVAFFKKYKLSSSLMGSTMNANTVMGKFLGFQSSDVIHIWRVTNEGISRAYRLVKLTLV